MSDSHGPAQIRHPVSYDDAATSNYLAAGDFVDGPRTFKILEIEIVPIEDDNGALNDKFVYHLEGAEKPWLSNRTNGYLLEGIFGPDPMAPKGQFITLHAENVYTSEGYKPAVRMYGSPFLKADKKVEYKLKRKKKTFKIMKATKAPGATATTPPPKPIPPPPAKPSVDPKDRWLRACAKLNYESDTAKGWAVQVLEKEWDAVWTVDDCKRLGDALAKAGGSMD